MQISYEGNALKMSSAKCRPFCSGLNVWSGEIWRGSPEWGWSVNTSHPIWTGPSWPLHNVGASQSMRIWPPGHSLIHTSRALTHGGMINWLTFCRRYFQINFLEWKLWCLRHPENQGVIVFAFSGPILGLCPANERRRYKVTASLIGWAQT